MPNFLTSISNRIKKRKFSRFIKKLNQRLNVKNKSDEEILKLVEENESYLKEGSSERKQTMPAILNSDRSNLVKGVLTKIEPTKSELESIQDHIYKKVDAGDLFFINLLANRKLGALAQRILNRKDDHGYTPLNNAIINKPIEVVQALIDAGADINLANNRKETPLHIAVKNKRFDVLKTLVKCNPLIGKQDCCGRTPLFLAVKSECFDAVDILINESEGVCLDSETNNGRTPLFIAAAENYPGIVKELIEAGADIDHQANNGATPLCVAAQEGHNEIVEFLVKKRANKSLAWGERIYLKPIHMAAQNGHLDVIKTLLANSDDKDGSASDGQTPLYIAAKYGELEVVEHLIHIKANIEIAAREDDDILTPLLIAAKEGHAKVVKALVMAGAEQSPLYENQVRPLDIAVAFERLNVVKTLIELDAHKNKPAGDLSGLLSLAAQKGNVKIFRALYDAFIKIDETKINLSEYLLIAVQNNHLPLVKDLLTTDANKNYTTPLGQSLLYIAALKGHLDVVKALLDAGAIKDLAANDGATPLYIAACNGKLDVVNALIQKSANLNQPTNDGVSPLYIAVQNGHLNVVDALIEASADINLATTENNRTPLWVAAHKGDLNVVLRLLKAGADANKASLNGKSPQYIAAEKGHLEVVQALLAAKAQLNSVTDSTKSALHIAAEKGHVDVVKSLLSFDADPTLSDAKGATPLLSAAMYDRRCRGGGIEIVKALVKHPNVTLEMLADYATNRSVSESIQTLFDKEIKSKLHMLASYEPYRTYLKNWPKCRKSHDYIIHSPVRGMQNRLYEHDNYLPIMRYHQQVFKERFDPLGDYDDDDFCVFRKDFQPRVDESAKRTITKNIKEIDFFFGEPSGVFIDKLADEYFGQLSDEFSKYKAQKLWIAEYAPLNEAILKKYQSLTAATATQKVTGPEDRQTQTTASGFFFYQHLEKLEPQALVIGPFRNTE